MVRNHVELIFFCHLCRDMVTEESVFRAIPAPYQAILTGEFGQAAASLLDIGAIDVINSGLFRPLQIEYPRENQV
jgi:hypothetical protein